MFRRAFKFSLLIFLALRLGASLLLLVAALNSPPNLPPAPYSPQVVADLQRRGAFSRYFLLPWYRWDTVHYLEIAGQGYSSNLIDTVWPPLYPLLVRALAQVIQPPLLAALVVSNLAALAAMILLYLLVAEIWDEALARRVLFWVAIFPAAFFLVAAYTESLFLALSLGAWLAARRRRWLLAGLLAALATLTRLQGVFLVLPLAGEALLAGRRTGWREVLPWLARLLPLALAPLSLALFGAYVRFGLHAAWPWQTLSTGWHLRMAWPWEGVIGNLALMAHHPVDFSILSLFYDAILAIWAVFLLLRGSQDLPAEFSLFAFLMLLPALVKVRQNETLMSLLRYVLPIFPLFISQARFLRQKPVQVAWAIFCLAGQGVLLWMFYRWVFVA